jgi:hypothetical protein
MSRPGHAETPITLMPPADHTLTVLDSHRLRAIVVLNPVRACGHLSYQASQDPQPTTGAGVDLQILLAGAYQQRQLFGSALGVVL